MTVVPENCFVWQEYLIADEYAWDKDGHKIKLKHRVIDVCGNHALASMSIFKLSGQCEFTLVAPRMGGSKLFVNHFECNGKAFNYDGEPHVTEALSTTITGDSCVLWQGHFIYRFEHVTFPMKALDDGIGICCKDMVQWLDTDTGPALRQCANPWSEAPQPCDFVNKGSWLEVHHDGKKYVFAEAVTRLREPSQVELANEADVASTLTILPLELCGIVDMYVGNTHITWTTTGCASDDAAGAIVCHGVQLVDAAFRLVMTKVGCDISVSFPMMRWSVFENNLVIQSGCGVFVVDLDDAKNMYTTVPAPIAMHVVCGQESFKLGCDCYLYEQRGTLLSAPYWKNSETRIDADIGVWHYIVEDGRVSEQPLCDKCVKTCLLIQGIHFNVPAFGRCNVHFHCRGTRVIVVLAGLQGIHFQISETDKTNETVVTPILWGTDNTHTYARNAPSVFAGDCVSIRDEKGDWITYC